MRKKRQSPKAVFSFSNKNNHLPFGTLTSHPYGDDYQQRVFRHLVNRFPHYQGLTKVLGRFGQIFEQGVTLQPLFWEGFRHWPPPSTIEACPPPPGRRLYITSKRRGLDTRGNFKKLEAAIEPVVRLPFSRRREFTFAAHFKRPYTNLGMRTPVERFPFTLASAAVVNDNTAGMPIVSNAGTVKNNSTVDEIKKRFMRGLLVTRSV